MSTVRCSLPPVAMKDGARCVRHAVHQTHRHSERHASRFSHRQACSPRTRIATECPTALCSHIRDACPRFDSKHRAGPCRLAGSRASCRQETETFPSFLASTSICDIRPVCVSIDSPSLRQSTPAGRWADSIDRQHCYRQTRRSRTLKGQLQHEHLLAAEDRFSRDE